MHLKIRRLIIFLLSLVCFLNSGCKKNDIAVTNNPPPIIYKDKDVRLTSPRENDVWIRNTVRRIVWSIYPDSVVKRVEIQIQKKVNTAFEFYFEAQADSLYRDLWINADTSSYCKLRIKNVASEFWDTTDVFQIRDNTSKICSPSKGEIFYRGDIVKINYLNASKKPVAFDVTTDDGKTWNEIVAAGKPAQWSVQQQSSNQCRVRMRDGKNIYANSDLFEIRDYINPNFIITYPNDGAVITPGSIVNIQYTNSIGKQIHFDLTIDNGTTWNNIIESVNNAVWFVANTPSNRCRIRMQTNDSMLTTYSGLFRIADKPDQNFYIISPAKDDIWYQQSIISIKYQNQYSSSVAFELTTDNGSTWKEIIKQNGGSHWYVEPSASNKCRIRMRSADGLYKSVSDIFSIDSGLDPYFKFISPIEGESLRMGTYYTIKYNSAPWSNLIIDLSTDDGTKWNKLWSINSEFQDTGSYIWIISSGASDQCRLRLSREDGTKQFITGRFRIVQELDEFFPLAVGQIYKYEYVESYSYFSTGEHGIRSNNYRIIEILAVDKSNDPIVYTCKLTIMNKDSTIQSVTNKQIKEYKSGLHKYETYIDPFKSGSDFSPDLFRYMDKDLSDYSDNRNTGGNINVWNYTMKKGIGLTSYEYIYKKAMHDYDYETFTLR